ncbi:MAG: hypothetical protein HPY44_20895 [Armatimonadetes bacterium]|nr:hypothetical protein [Armatimonadota bacterium]
MRAMAVAAAFAVAAMSGIRAEANAVSLQRTVVIDGHELVLDTSPVKISLEAAPVFENEPRQADLARKLFRSHSEAWHAAQKAGVTVLPSVSLVQAKCKKLDDGIYAAVELAAEDGIGKIRPGKHELLVQLLTAVNNSDVSSSFGEEAARLAVSRIYGAFKNAGFPLEFTSARLVGRLPDESRKPVGFYTWNLQLERIFKRDTALQSGFNLTDPEELAAACLIVKALWDNPSLRGSLEATWNLYARLTNPLVSISPEEIRHLAESVGGLAAATDDPKSARRLADKFRDAPAPPFALLPRSFSREGSQIQTGGMDAFISSVRDGSVSLKPDADSGWYQHQMFSLEPLLMPDKFPEGAKLELSEEYRKLMEAQFRSIASQIRETHAKQIPPEAAAPPVELPTHLSVEPFPTVYQRLAQSYEFLSKQLVERIGIEALSLHARDEGGVERPDSIGDEVRRLRGLLSGLELLARRDIGVAMDGATKGPDVRAEGWKEFAERWLARWHEDPDMARDVRMMVPVGLDPPRHWAVLGVRLARIKARYLEPPKVVKGDAYVNFGETEYWLPIEEMVEVTGMREPLNHEEFRALCDRAGSAEEIVRSLQQAGGQAQLPPAEQGKQPAIPMVSGPAWVLLSVLILALIGLVVWRLIQGALGR